MKVEENPTVPQKLKEMHDGNEKWKLKHLSNDTNVQALFTEKVAPLAHKKAATLDPWSNLNIDEVQAIVDQVYGAGKFEVKEDGPWLGLVRIMVQPKFIYLTLDSGHCSFARLAKQYCEQGIGNRR